MKKALYKITNCINNKVYIGQSIRPHLRWKEHIYHAKKGDDSFPIHLAIAKYGEENFSFEIIEYSDDYDNREMELIREYNSISPNGYNVLDGSSKNPVFYGEDNYRNTISENVVSAIIFDLINTNLSDVFLSQKYKTTLKIIADINHGITHKRDDLCYPLRVRKGRTGGIPENTLNSIIYDLINTQDSYRQIAKRYNLSYGMIGHINTGRYKQLDGYNYPLRRNMLQ